MEFAKPWHERAYEYRREAGAPKKTRRPKAKKPLTKRDRRQLANLCIGAYIRLHKSRRAAHLPSPEYIPEVGPELAKIRKLIEKAAP